LKTMSLANAPIRKLREPRPPVPSLRVSPLSLGGYIQLHKTIIAQFRERGFVGPDATTDRSEGKHVIWHGEIGCLGRIVLGVRKVFELLDSDRRVWPIEYSYNVSISGVGNIFRYDNQHTHPGHTGAFHRHDFDWTTNTEKPGSPICIGWAWWPKLEDVLEESYEWYWRNCAYLPDAESFPDRLLSHWRHS
jgi:hypothetical protein